MRQRHHRGGLQAMHAIRGDLATIVVPTPWLLITKVPPSC
ncbi:MAG: hypothetical protein QOE79_416, partial [Sphingomonadales bacterium]|nr:hypothetical protein [Sphingomonadales bacterium]